MEQYYWCPNCFNVFDEPGFTREWVADECGEHCELWSCCPRCESTDFEQAEQCEDCGGWFAPNEINADGLCGNCTYKSLTALFERKVKEARAG